jgi:UTP:GlnB (protein PII) uridylyltransferase
MSNNNDNKTVTKPLGKAIQWSEADLERLSAISEADIAAAGELWQQNASQRFKRLLEARPTEADNSGDTQE